jgi:hypothetical protein
LTRHQVGGLHQLERRQTKYLSYLISILIK